MLLLLLAIIALPILEVMLLIEVSEHIGAWNTFSIVLLSAFLGIFFTKREGREVLFQLRKDTGRGILPAESILHGILIFIGGLLLIIPGFITDVIGLSLLIPWTRSFVVARLKVALQKSLKSGKIQVHTFGPGSASGFHAYSAYSSSDPFFEEKEIREAKVIDIETKRLEKQSSLEPKEP